MSSNFSFFVKSLWVGYQEATDFRAWQFISISLIMNQASKIQWSMSTSSCFPRVPFYSHYIQIIFVGGGESYRRSRGSRGAFAVLCAGAGAGKSRAIFLLSLKSSMRVPSKHLQSTPWKIHLATLKPHHKARKLLARKVLGLYRHRSRRRCMSQSYVS